MMTKFPGGGLKPGEGVLDCLRREWKEELEVELKSAQLLYTPSGYIQSAFRATDQIVPLYFQVEVPDLGALRVSEVAFDFESGVDESQSFRWVDIFELAPTYPGDQEVVAFLRALKS